MRDDWKTLGGAVTLVAGTLMMLSGPPVSFGAVPRPAVAGVAPMAVLNEVHADPDATDGDANGDGTVQSAGDEFVEIVNPGAAALDMSGWTLADGIGTRHVFPAGTMLGAGCGVVVFGGGVPVGAFGGMPVHTASSGSLGLNNGGDTLVLHDGSGIVLSYTYGSEGGDNQSLTRDPDVVGTLPLVRHVPAAGSGGARFSPGTRIGGAPFAGCGSVIPTATATATPLPTPSATATLPPPAPTVTAIATSLPTPSATATLLPPTPTVTATEPPTASPTQTATPIQTATITATPVPTTTETPTPVATMTATPLPTATASTTSTPTITATSTATPTLLPTVTPTSTATPSASPTFVPTLTPTVASSPTPTAAVSGCTSHPRIGCRASRRPARSLLVVRDHDVDRRDRLVWKWRKGEVTSVADFGDPRGGDPYALCIYDESGADSVLLLDAAVPANATCPDGDCWVQARAGARVLRYRSTSRGPDGVERIVLKPGDDGAARITLQARGSNLRLPELPVPLPLRVQLQGPGGACWESHHAASGTRRNDTRMFRGHGG